MEPEIIVYDGNNIQLGKTFSRRAKQLVAKGRAVWTNNGQTEIVLAEESIVDMREAAPERAGESDDLLRHLAKERVQRRKLIRRHIWAYIAAVPFTILMLAGFSLRLHEFNFALGFSIGVLTLWGAWIFVQVMANIRERMRHRFPKPDEVEMEFLRLKAAGR